jgi:hypothetical protein
MMSTAEKIRREALRKGLEQGIEKGIERGRVWGKADLLLRLLAMKFGAVAEGIEHRVRSGSISDLDRWAIAVLHADKLDQVFEDR